MQYLDQDAEQSRRCVAHELLTQVEEFLIFTGRNDLSEKLMAARSKIEKRIAADMDVAVTPEEESRTLPTQGC